MAIAQTTATPPEAPTPSPPATERARALGLPSATALVIGSIIGTGVFTMPAVLSGAGTSSLLVLGVIAIGAVLLGTMIGQLTKRVPNSNGGLYAYARHDAYARHEFGDFAGFLTAWCYWITAWAGNARHRVLMGSLRRIPLLDHTPVGLDQPETVDADGIIVPIAN
jgi:APA family basic amino acid/polyamine antiporter